MAIDNGGTKNNQGLLHFKADLVYIGDFVICSLVSCSHHMAVSLGLVMSFPHSRYLATSPGQTESNEVGGPMRGEVILMLGCVKMACLFVPPCNAEETSGSEALTRTIVLTPC